MNELSRLPLQSTESDGRALHPHVIPSAPNNLTYFSSDGVSYSQKMLLTVAGTQGVP